MGAICGIINKNQKVDTLLLSRMLKAISYRGNREEVFFVKENIGLGLKEFKLSNLDTTKPFISNEDNTIFLVCDGMIYNYKDLRISLEKKGHKFKSSSDNEVIIHLYEEKGVNLLNDLRGIFAFGLWDNRKKELFLARDRVGKKPLIYSVVPEGFIFASEIKSLLFHPEIKKEIDLHSLDLFITYQAVPSPKTIFKGINKLEPAQYLLWKNNNIKIERYWDVDFTKKIALKNEEEYSQLLWEKLVDSTKLCVSGDISFGVFLSGGLDSTVIAGIVNELSPRKIKTFSVGFEEEEFNELKYASIAAKFFGSEHNEFILKSDIIEVLPKLIWHYNEPFADSSMLATYYLTYETKKYVDVILNGDGGDESLAGYTRYWQTLMLERAVKFMKVLPSGIKKSVMNSFLKGYEKKASSNFFRVWKWVDELEKYGYEYAYGRMLTAFSNEYKEKLYSPMMKDTLKNFSSLCLLKGIWEQAGNISLLEKMLYADQHLYLPEVLSVKMDIATMSNSLETMSPFLDHKFIELLASFPPNLKLKKATTKYILKKRVGGFIPKEIIYRKKMGFGVPLGKWFKGELKDYLSSYLLSDKFDKRGFFNSTEVKTMVQEHTSGKVLHTSRLWSLLVFELWYRVFIDGEGL